MYIKINKRSNLKNDEIILFVLSDYRRKNIISVAALLNEFLEIAIENRDSIQSLLDNIQNKDWITFNGNSYDLPILHKYFPLLKVNTHIDLYDLFKKNIYLTFPNYRMETLLKAENRDLKLKRIEELNTLYKDKNIDQFISSIENQMAARSELNDILKQSLRTHSFSFNLGEFRFLLSVHKVSIRKDFLYIELLSDNKLPEMEFHYHHYSIKTISVRSMEIKTYVYEGIVQDGKIGKVVHSETSEIQQNSLLKDFYPVELEGKLLIHSIENWTKSILKNIY